MKKASIETAIAGGLALAAGAAANIALGVQSAKKKSQQRVAKRAARLFNASYVTKLLSVAGANTTLTNSVPANSTVLPVGSSNGFYLGRQVLIDAGTPVQEANIVAGFGSLVLKNPLAFAHGTGATVIEAGANPVKVNKAFYVIAVVGLPLLCCAVGFLLVFCWQMSSSQRKKRTGEIDYEDPEGYETENEEAPLLSAERMQRIAVAQEPPRPNGVQFVQELRQPEPVQDPGIVFGAPPTYGLPPAAPSAQPQQAPQVVTNMQQRRPVAY